MPRESTDPAELLLRKLGGSCLTQVVATAAKLGLPDALAEGPKTLSELSLALGCVEPLLGRLVPILVGEGILCEGADDTLALTEVGRQLGGDALGPLAVFLGAMPQWAAWGALDQAIQTGEAAFRLVHGADFYDYLAEHPEDARIYDAAMNAFTHADARALAEVYDFSTARSVVDVGGGWGAVLSALLERYPGLRGVLLETPEVAGRARARLATEPFADRLDVVGGDFTRAVPEGADVYVVKHVIHNWDDEDCEQLLRRCASAMAPGGRVLVVDYVLMPGVAMDMARLLDLEMMVLTGRGRERSKNEFRLMFRAAGLVLTAAHPLAGPNTRLLVGERKSERAYSR